ncbi:hypothetical protein QVD17_12231 [Tagetes erecta]|uniref:Pectinesterase inhibitor domain-containing protein n=1 Tax=Tagetes erecta TaxID=13708 RepID=A0AAD8P1H5_TARER|nr:hypothetical protein QVD17_12231 [Tagetes erecta]
MHSFSISYIFYVFLVSLVITMSKVAIEEPYELVNKVCKKQGNQKFCVEVLKSDTRSEFAKDIRTLTAIAVDVATKNTTATRNYFQRVKTGPPGVLKSLKSCIDLYNNVIMNLKICLHEEDCSLIGYDIHVARDEVMFCQEIADSNRAHDSFITTSNDVTLEFCGLGESLANLMCYETRA